MKNYNQLLAVFLLPLDEASFTHALMARHALLPNVYVASYPPPPPPTDFHLRVPIYTPDRREPL